MRRKLGQSPRLGGDSGATRTLPNPGPRRKEPPKRRPSLGDRSDAAPLPAVGSDAPFSPRAQKRLLPTQNPFPAPRIAGRQRELEMVYDAFRPYVRGQVVKRSEEAPTVLLVEGGVGLGKSKLAEEAVHVADAMEFMVVSSTAEKVETTIDVRATFDKIDTDGSGTLDREEVERAAQELGHEFVGQELDEAMATMDANGDGEVSFEEFMRWGELVPVGGWGQKLSGLTYIDVRATFDKIDTDGSGTLDRHEVERAAQELGHEFVGQELDEAMAKMDANGDGEVSFEEFMRWGELQKGGWGQKLSGLTSRGCLEVFRNLMEALLDVEVEELLRREAKEDPDREWQAGEARMAALKQIFEEDGSDDSDSDDDDSSEDAGQNSLWHMLPLLKGTVLETVEFSAAEEERVRSIEGESRQAKIMQLLRHWLEDASEEHDRLCIVLEDAQYMDPTSWRMLEQVADLTGVVWVLCLRSGSVLPERTHFLTSNTALCRHIVLDAMDKDDVEALLRAKWDAAVSSDIVDIVFERGAGNPFHSEQLADSISRPDKSGRALTRETNGTVGLAPHVEPHDIKFPEGLHGLITAQLDIMPAEDRNLLKRAAVVGTTVTAQLLAEVHQNPAVLEMEGRDQAGVHVGAARITELLDRLCEKEIFHQPRQRSRTGTLSDGGAGGGLPRQVSAGGTAEPVYAFTQQLMQEVAYKLNLVDERKRVHRATAEALEAREGVVRKVEDAQMLAYHWGRAGELQKDVEYLERAGERALAVYANKDASQIFRTILKKTEQAAHSAEPANAWAKQGQGKWLMLLAVAEQALGNSASAEKSLQDAVKLYNGGMWARQMTDGGSMQAKIDEMLAEPTAPHVDAASAESCRELSKLHDMLSESAFFAGAQQKRRYCCLLAHHFAQRSGSGPEIAIGHALVTVSVREKDLALAEEHCRLGVKMAHEVQEGDPSTALKVFMLTSLYATDRGQWDEAVRGWGEMVAIAKRMGNADKLEMAGLQLCWARYNHGQLEEAYAVCNEARASARKRGDSFMRCRCLVMMAHCSLAMRQDERAREKTCLAREQLDLACAKKGASEAQLRGAEIQQYGLEALVLLRSGEYEAAYELALKGAKMISVHQAKEKDKMTQSNAIIGYAAYCEVFAELLRHWCRPLRRTLSGQAAAGGAADGEAAAAAERLMRTPDAKLLQLRLNAFHSVHALSRFSEFPGAQPIVDAMKARVDELVGRATVDRTAGQLQKAADSARDLGMPLQQGLICFHLGCVSFPPTPFSIPVHRSLGSLCSQLQPRVQKHARTARQLFCEVGAELFADLCEPES